MLRLIGCPSCKSQFAIPDPSTDPTFSPSDTVFVEELSLHCSHCDTVFLLGLNPFFEQTGEFISTDELHSHGLQASLSTVESNPEMQSIEALGSFDMDTPETTVREEKLHPDIEEDIFEEADGNEPIQESLFTFTEELMERELSAEDPLSEETYAIEEEEVSFGDWESPAYLEEPELEAPELIVTEEELWNTPLSEGGSLRGTSEWKVVPEESEYIESNEALFLDPESNSSEGYDYKDQPNPFENRGQELEEDEFLKNGDPFENDTLNEKHIEASTSDEELEFTRMGGFEDHTEANDSGFIDLGSVEPERSDATIPEWEEIDELASLHEHDELKKLPDNILEEQSLVQKNVHLFEDEIVSDVFDESAKNTPQDPRDTRSLFNNGPEEAFRSEPQRATHQDFAQVISIATPQASDAEEERGSEVRYEHATYQSKTLSSSTTTTLFTALIVLILVGLGGFSVFLESDGPYQQRIKALISTDLPLPASHRITLDQVVLKKHSLTSGEEIFSIDAQLENGEDLPVSQIIGEGALYDSQGVLLMKRQLPLGKFLSLEPEVKSAEEAFSLQEQFSNRSTRVNAQERKKVRILFRANEVQDAHFFTMRPLAVYR